MKFVIFWRVNNGRMPWQTKHRVDEMYNGLKNYWIDYYYYKHKKNNKKWTSTKMKITRGMIHKYWFLPKELDNHQDKRSPNNDYDEQQQQHHQSDDVLFLLVPNYTVLYWRHGVVELEKYHMPWIVSNNS